MSSSESTLLQALKDARKSKGLTQKQLAQKVGLDAAHVSRIEGGRIRPQISTLLEIARVLELEIMLVPREKVPAVKAVARTQRGKDLSQPMWSSEELDVPTGRQGLTSGHSHLGGPPHGYLAINPTTSVAAVKGVAFSGGERANYWLDEDDD